MTLLYTLGTQTISVLINGIPITAHCDDIDMDGLMQVVQRNDVDTKAQEAEALQYLSPAKTIELKFKSVEVKDGQVYYKGELLDNYVVDAILRVIELGADPDRLLRFVERLMQNPSMQTVKDLYKFLEYGGFPITDDGCFVGYKKVRANFMDCHSGKFDNSPGKEISMPRNQVCDDRDQGCAAGLHVGTYEYATGFYGDRIVLVKVAPEDVVAVPTDYSFQKMRVWRYKVLQEIPKSGKLDELYFKEQ